MFFINCIGQTESNSTVHLMLSNQEMEHLLSSHPQWKQPILRLGDSFDVLVTEVVDSCHFWANADDGVGIRFNVMIIYM